MVRDPQRGKYRRTRLFVLTLGYSRKSVRLLTWVRRKGGDIADSLSLADVLRKLPDAENVEPQMLTQSVRRKV